MIDLGFGNPDLASPPVAVEKLTEAAAKPRNHRYSASRGIPKLRSAICDLYRDRFGVELDPGDAGGRDHRRQGRARAPHVGARAAGRHRRRARALVSDPPLRAYPRRRQRRSRSSSAAATTSSTTGSSTRSRARGRARVRSIVSFPHNPTTRVVDLGFMARLVALARENDALVVHDFAYADISFDGYSAALDPPGSRRRRGRRRDLLSDEVVLDGRLARRVRARERSRHSRRSRGSSPTSTTGPSSRSRSLRSWR